ncbi:LPXTG cell wall anchor domain-containing protein [Companilactobacillus zhongbaensis]|uniref:LPXTG cell wall anchor domain-containing protein n=1 Tax=Companilactobacillus zhongbaensis TaxID=2486009 RepID=UPI000F781F95|nr:LPXTG cell wall anchor domain-containing protein [Companilactobacillus zhongbaensis]
MTNKTLNHTNKTMSSKIKYTDLAIAIALSSASLFLIPGVSKAATTTDSTTSPTSSTEVATDTSSTSGTTTPTTTTSDTPTTGTTATGTSTTGATTTDGTSPTTSTSSTGTTAQPASGTSTTSTTSTTTTASSPTTSTSTTSTTAPVTTAATTSTSTSTTTQSSTSTTSGATAGFTYYKVPAAGYELAYEPSTSTTTPATYSVSVQAYGTDDRSLGSAIPVASGQAADSSYTLDWTPALLDQLNASFPNSGNYTAWTPASLTAPLTIPVTNSNVLVKVYYALKTVTVTYTYIDETTGKTLYQQANTYDFTDAANNTTFKTDGIRPATAVLDSSTHFLTPDDTSTAAQTNSTALPYFGPDGMIFNNTSYVLDSQKSGGITPLSYIYWPQSDTTRTFYYTEGNKPTITINAVDSLGNPLKTFDTDLTPTATLPAETITGASYLPTAAEATIPGYSLTGFTSTATDSLSGVEPTTVDNKFDLAQYETFLASPENAFPYDARALGDYQNMNITFTYQGDPVTLMVQPVDSNGNKIGDPIPAAQGFVGESLNLASPTVAGYSPTNESLQVTLQPGQTAIPVIYYAENGTSTYDDTGSSTGATGTTSPSDTTTSDTDETPSSEEPSEPNSSKELPDTFTPTEVFPSETTQPSASTTTEESPAPAATEMGSGYASSADSETPASATDMGSSTSSTTAPSATATGSSTSPTPASSSTASGSPTAHASLTPLTYSKSATPATSTATSLKKTYSTTPFYSASSASKLPQTGEKTISLLSAIGLALLGIAGLAVDKLKKVF